MIDELQEQPLERPAFFDGQRLLAGDLNSVARTQRELRWLHNRGLHNWGIAFGYELTGAVGDRLVSVAPGYAIDCRGRDLVLSQTIEMAIPPVPGPATYYLTASYAADEELEPVLRAGACDASGAVRWSERPLILWRDPTSTDEVTALRPGLDLVLGSALVLNCRLAKAVSGAARRSAKPEAQPYIAAGATIEGQTKWEPWPQESPIGVATTVSTAAAGFRTTPRYQAHVLGKRLNSAGSVFDGFPHVHKPTPTDFQLRLVMPSGQIGHIALLNPSPNMDTENFCDMLKSQLGWHVSWLGIGG